MSQPSMRKPVLQTLALALLALFLIPGLAYIFTAHVERRINADVVASARNSGAGGEEMAAFFSEHPATEICDRDDAATAALRAELCASGSAIWQMHLARRTSAWMLVAGVGVLAFIGLLSAWALRNANALPTNLKAGRWGLIGFCTVAVIVQGALAVWLSFWVTAYFLNMYSIKLIGVIGIAALAAIFVSITTIFRKLSDENPVIGTLLTEANASRLWQYVRSLADKVGTAPPKQIVAGIDTNFFVTEAPLHHESGVLSGRTLFVSIPLLRVLDFRESGAVLAHELAHLAGGDTAGSARLGPELTRFDHYRLRMAESGVTVFVFWLLNLYRMAVEFALKAESRRREFAADAVAARTVAASAISRALVKVAAYAGYRGQVEQSLFDADRRHDDDLGIADSIARGLPDYARSDAFVGSVRETNVPHPFDSHPPLSERMQNVGFVIEESQYAATVLAPVAANWADAIDDGVEIERGLWAHYEQQFVAMHEQSLAFRYEPANETEAALVEKYFPALQFALNRGQVEVNHSALVFPDRAEPMSWDQVKDLKYEDGFGGDVLTVTHPDKGWLGAKTSKIKLPGIKPQRDAFKQALGVYWTRHRAMREWQQASQRSTL
jgi:Zn-dependent protease with chaperone function